MSEYGAIPKSDGEADNSFEEYDVDYVQERKLSFKERINKFFTAGIPIIIAVLIVVAFGLWTTKALAPAPSQTSVHTPAHSPVPATSPVVEKTPVPAPAPSSTAYVPEPTTSAGTVKGNGGKACSTNPACKDLGLVGDCCPTSEGIELGCCM